MAKKKKAVRRKKVVRVMDEFDLAAAREGESIKKASETRVRKAGKKPNVGPVDSRTLDKSFVDRYGDSGYEAKGEEDDSKRT